jgi:hypothetical protein
LITRGIRSENIGVITPYRQQIKLIGSLLDEEYAGVEVMTADKSQGRDKDCIVISMVRSNEVGNVSHIRDVFREEEERKLNDESGLSDWGVVEGLEKDKRLAYSSEEEVDHFRVKDDSTDGSVVERVFRVHGGAGVDDEST